MANGKKKGFFSRNVDRLVMGAIIGAAVGSVVGASLRKKDKDENEPVEWFEVPSKSKKKGFFSRLFGRKEKIRLDEMKSVPDESQLERK